MNKKIPYLTRKMVYGFLIGLLVGGFTIAIFDSYAKQPLFSSAFIPGSNTHFCLGADGSTCVESGGSAYNQATYQTSVNVLPDDAETTWFNEHGSDGPPFLAPR